MRRFSFLSRPWPLALALGACSESPVTPARADAGATPDALAPGRDAAADAPAVAPDVAPPPDAGPPPDLPPPDLPIRTEPSELGGSCTFDSDCADGNTCHDPADGYTEGLCSPACASDAACPGDALCNGEVCVLRCRDNADCRLGYACLAVGAGTACTPGCDSPDDCPEGSTCDLGRSKCSTPGAGYGAPCRGTFDCQHRVVCMAESEVGFPGGLCSVEGCVEDDDCTDDFPGTVCRNPPGEEDTGFCFAACGDGCRPGWACVDGACMPACSDGAHCAFAAGRLCAPSGLCTGPFDRRGHTVGDECSREFRDCPGGFCFTEEEGFPFGMCSTDDRELCESLERDGVPQGVWIEDEGYCTEECSKENRCNKGYHCGPEGGCVPGG